VGSGKAIVKPADQTATVPEEAREIKRRVWISCPFRRQQTCSFGRRLGQQSREVDFWCGTIFGLAVTHPAPRWKVRPRLRLLCESLPPLLVFALCQGHQHKIPELNRTVIALQLNRPRPTFERVYGNPRQAVDHSLFVKLLSI
jgi:hypothetical protein